MSDSKTWIADQWSSWPHQIAGDGKTRIWLTVDQANLLQAKADLADEHARTLSWKLIQAHKPLPKVDAEWLRQHMALTAKPEGGE